VAACGKISNNDFCLELPAYTVPKAMDDFIVNNEM
jgi:hypothetical protein